MHTKLNDCRSRKEPVIPSTTNDSIGDACNIVITKIKYNSQVCYGINVHHIILYGIVLPLLYICIQSHCISNIEHLNQFTLALYF